MEREHWLGLESDWEEACKTGDMARLKRELAKPNHTVDINTALCAASAYGSYDIVRYLLQQEYTNVHFMEEEPLLSAVFHDQNYVVRLLIEYGANYHVLNDLPLILAAKRGNLSTFEFLFDYDYSNDTYDEAMLVAVEEGHWEIVKKMVDDPIEIFCTPWELQGALARARAAGHAVDAIEAFLRDNSLLSQRTPPAPPQVHCLPAHVLHKLHALSSPEDTTCSVCLEQTTEETFTAPLCGHFYCKTCLARLKECGVCKTQFTYQ